MDLQDRDTGRARKKVEGIFLRRNGPEALTGVSDDLKQESGWYSAENVSSISVEDIVNVDKRNVTRETEWKKEEYNERGR
jgi:hypothetical protein